MRFTAGILVKNRTRQNVMLCDTVDSPS